MNAPAIPPVGRCARIPCGSTEALVSLDVGPRVIAYGPVGGPNLFAVFEDGAPLGDGGCKLYGGHRLWYGPEDAARTYHADNESVDHREEGGEHVFSCRPDPFGIRKTIRIRADAAQEALHIRHVLTNASSEPASLFPWALTVMAPGGECAFPLPPFRSHVEDALPAGPLVLWSYTRMGDPRWSWGSHVVRLRQASIDAPQKVGALVRQGIAAYANHGLTFLKRFEYVAGTSYPDFGCNFETFTRRDMLEVESLGPMYTLQPKESCELRETWYVLRESAPPTSDEACGEWFEDLASKYPL